MADGPYTLPEEDPFSANPLPLCMQPQRPVPRRRRSSLLDKWIHDQRTHQGSSSHDLQCTLSKESTNNLSAYDLVEDDDIPENSLLDLEHSPTPVASTSRRSSRLLQTPSSFRSFGMSFRSSSPSTSNHSESGSTRLSRFTLLARNPRHSADVSIPGSAGKSHANNHRTSTISTISLNNTPSTPASDFSPVSTTPSRWRPSVLAHSSSSSFPHSYLEPPDATRGKSRPSLSSNDTQTATTSDNSDFPITPTQNNLLDHAHARGSSSSVFRSGPGFASSSSIWSQPQKQCAFPAPTSAPAFSIPYALSSGPMPHAQSQPMLASRIPLAPKPTSYNYNPHTGLGGGDLLPSDHDDSEDEDDINDRTIMRAPAPTQPQVAYSSSGGGTLPRVKFSALTIVRHKKKKRKLVISGIAHGDAKKFEGVKKWCESFGEVNQIVRMPNGDLHVHFRLAEVAETVCRVKAKVYIAGVGSVQLSWYTGEKR